MTDDPQESIPLSSPEDDDLAAALALLQQSGGDETADTASDPVPPAASPPISPTLAALEALRRPSLTTVCETCPNSVWFSSPQEVKCYCRVMYLVTWSTQEPTVLTGCDGIFIGQAT